MSLNPVPALAANPPGGVSCTCGCYSRPRRYPSDTTDAQWEILAALLPEPACRRPGGGRPERHHRRAIIDAIFYLVDNGVKWRALPVDFPPWATVYGFHARWSDDLTVVGLANDLRAALRVAQGRHPNPTAGCIDAQSVSETAEATVPKATSGFDPHKRVNGRKRHILVDTLGLLIAAHVTTANTHDRDGAPPLLHTAAALGVRHLWADKAYRGDLVTQTRTSLGITIEIAAEPSKGNGFQVVPRRWVVERTFAWISRRRRCARDHERLPDHHEAIVYWAAIIQMTRQRARLT